MRSVLTEFAYGNISPEPRSFKQNSEYGKAMDVLVKAEEKLSATLTEEQQVLLKDYSFAQMEIACLTGVDKFIYGYRLGVLTTMEVFNGGDDLIVGSDVAQ